MPTLHLGVIDIPYATEVPEGMRRVGVKTRKGGKPQAFSAAPKGGETTGDVATFLEDEYHVMEVFFEDLGADLIAKALERSAVLAIKSMNRGAPTAGLSLSGRACEEIQEAFHDFITQQEMDFVVGGVPTKASLEGISHRKAKVIKTGISRPSFVDTGTYLNSFKAWVD